jgi:MHS family alpha-ketoglutarate permease-like MFS transporter
VIVLRAGGGMGFDTYTVYMQMFLVNTTGFDKGTASQVVTAVPVTMMLLMPVMGWISDRVGRKPVVMFSYGAGALLAVPVLTALATVTDPLTAFLLCLVPIVPLSGYNALSGILKAELFPTRVRALGVALPYAISQAIFGGNAETAALSFKKAGTEAGYFWLIAGVLGLGSAWGQRCGTRRSTAASRKTPEHRHPPWAWRRGRHPGPRRPRGTAARSISAATPKPYSATQRHAPITSTPR